MDTRLAPRKLGRPDVYGVLVFTVDVFSAVETQEENEKGEVGETEVVKMTEEATLKGPLTGHRVTRPSLPPLDTTIAPMEVAGRLGGHTTEGGDTP